jgi:porphobilinogen synthase
MNIISQFPQIRLRRNRQNQIVRNWVQENYISVDKLVMPLFVVDGVKRQEPINSLPDHYRYSIDQLFAVIEKCIKLGISSIAIFPSIEQVKQTSATESYNQNGLIPKAIEQLKQRFAEQIMILTDVALDAYTPDGHDGISDSNGNVLNDITIELLVKQAVCHAQAGADFVCPSDMMDGRVSKIRNGLDKAGYINTGIIAHAVKYASNFYGPYREANKATKITTKYGKRGYHMNPANSDEALHEAILDLNEGADILMVKPAIHYLDIIYRLKTQLNKPIAAYHVSGEYALLKTAGNWLNFETAIVETMLCLRRAGADIIFTYAAIELATILAKANI